MRSVALDLGNRISFCEVSKGDVIARTTVTGLEHLMRWIGPNTPPARVAVEASREAWWVTDKLLEWGHDPLLVDTTRVKKLGVGQHRRKTDRIDAEVLARAVEEDRIPRAHLLSKHRQQLRMQLGVRGLLVETRAKYVTQVRALLRAHGKRLRNGKTENFVRLVQGTQLGAPLRGLVEPLTAAIEVLDQQIAVVNGKIESLCQREPVVSRLMTTPGVGTVVAAGYVSVVDDAHRFRRAHEVESYVGLVPSEYTSTRRRLGAISKHGNAYLRGLLTQAAWSVMRQRGDDPLKRWALQVMARRGKAVAVIALARRLAGILWALWRDGTVCEPARVGTESAHGLDQQAQSAQFQAAMILHAARKCMRHRKG